MLKHRDPGKTKLKGSSGGSIANAKPESTGSRRLQPPAPAKTPSANIDTTVPSPKPPQPTTDNIPTHESKDDSGKRKRSVKETRASERNGASKNASASRDIPSQDLRESAHVLGTPTSTLLSTTSARSNQAPESATNSPDGPHLLQMIISAGQKPEGATTESSSTLMAKRASSTRPLSGKDMIFRHLNRTRDPQPHIPAPNMLHSSTLATNCKAGMEMETPASSQNMAMSRPTSSVATQVPFLEQDPPSTGQCSAKGSTFFSELKGCAPLKNNKVAAACTPQEENNKDLIEKIERLARELSTGLYVDVQLPITPPPSPPLTTREGTEAMEGELDSAGTLPGTSRIFQDYRVLDRTNVRFSDGLAIEMVTTPFERTRVIVSGISPKLEWQDLGWYLSSFGAVIHKELTNNESGKHGKTARVRFAHHEEAENAIKCLDGQLGLATDLPLLAKYDTEIVADDRSANVVADGVIVRWKRPAPKLRLYYRSTRIAKEAADVINMRTFCGHQLRATLRPSQHVIFVEGLSRDSDLNEFKRRHNPDKDPVFFDDHYDHTQVLKQMNDVFENAHLRHFEIKDTETETTIYSNFNSQNDAEEFLKEFGQLDLPWRAAARLCVIHAWDLLYVMHADKFFALQASIIDLAAKLRQVEIRLHVSTPSGHTNFRHIRVRGGNHIKVYKSMIDALLVGEVVTRNEKPLWDEDLEYLYGQRLFSDLRIDGVVFLERRRKRIMLMCGDDQRRVSLKRIYHRFDEAKRRICTHTFPRWQLRYFINATDSVIIPRSGRQEVLLDPRTCRIVVGGLVAGNHLKAIISDAPKSPPSFQTPKKSSANCPVCLDAPSEPVILSCQHQFCNSCLTRYLLSATQPDTVFPMRCFGDDGQCTRSVPLNVIRRLLTRDQFDLAASRSLKLYVDSKPEEYRHCPTSDCPHIFRLRAQTETVEYAEHCPGCFNKFCTACFLEGGHDGVTCTQAFEKQQLALAEQASTVEAWVKSFGGRTCPKCKMGLIKDGGCAHVQCSKCKVHICWTCGKAFDQIADESVYEHMRREHGSIGLIPWELEDWAADDALEWVDPPDLPTVVLPSHSSGSSGGSPATLRTTTTTTQNSQPNNRRNGRHRKRAGRKNPRPHRQPAYSDDARSEDEYDNFGGGRWDYDFADMNWESL
ncbi:hypothetical protein M408DRAFT_332783 [Serendipita vermifera MAFF 305830]|uniref:RING-type domain-containing protein n=1 Tax=Serendipita vermifera MAFF 305830 TaxID=933852 RepID=A0A0C2W8I5_SERVB|nr:hypothetical protein M408DRAFT_332783 [Serendipita vermifera MAFF 305830]